MAAAAVLIAALLSASMIYDMMRLITPGQTLWPLLARLRGRRAALEAKERWTRACFCMGASTGTPTSSG